MGELCKALGWVGVGVKPIRACLCLWSQRPSLLWCSPARCLNSCHYSLCLTRTFFTFEALRSALGP